MMRRGDKADRDIVFSVCSREQVPTSLTSRPAKSWIVGAGSIRVSSWLLAVPAIFPSASPSSERSPKAARLSTARNAGRPYGRPGVEIQNARGSRPTRYARRFAGRGVFVPGGGAARRIQAHGSRSTTTTTRRVPSGTRPRACAVWSAWFPRLRWCPGESRSSRGVFAEWNRPLRCPVRQIHIDPARHVLDQPSTQRRARRVSGVPHRGGHDRERLPIRCAAVPPVQTDEGFRTASPWPRTRSRLRVNVISADLALMGAPDVQRWSNVVHVHDSDKASALPARSPIV